MLEFKQSDVSTTIIVTLTELVAIPAPYFLFIFTNINTKDTVSFVLNSTADTSLFPARYNSFVINPSVLFAGFNDGQWGYRVYQQTSSTNTDKTLTQGVIESGRLILDKPVDYSYTKYDTATLIKAYAG